LITLDEAYDLKFEVWSKYYKEHLDKGLLNAYKILGLSKIDVVKAEGLFIMLDDNRKILDFTSSMGVLALGHNHPKIVNAEKKYLDSNKINAIKVGPNKLQAALAYNLSQLLPDPLSVSFFAVSGAEAVEGAMKLCEKVKGKVGKKFITTKGSYHGKTHGAMSVTKSEGITENFLMGIPRDNIIEVEYGNLNTLTEALKSNRSEIIATIIEPIQGQGIVVPPNNYLKQVVEICHNHDSLVIFDEVKTGLGRTGKFCCFQHSEAVPDVVTLSKALGGGQCAISAFVTKKELFEKAYGKRKDVGLHSSTFSGLGKSCAVAIQTLNVLINDGIINNCNEQGEYFFDELVKLKNKHKHIINEIRGKGLFLGIVFRNENNIINKISSLLGKEHKKNFDIILIASILNELFVGHNILVHFSVSDPNVLQITPPLTIKREQINHFIQSIDEVLSQGILQIIKKFILNNLIQTL
jgi:acetylornithine/succinyldiaminopimelate/putrescine aminotransferase